MNNLMESIKNVRNTTISGKTLVNEKFKVVYNRRRKKPKAEKSSALENFRVFSEERM